MFRRHPKYRSDHTFPIAATVKCFQQPSFLEQSNSALKNIVNMELLFKALYFFWTHPRRLRLARWEARFGKARYPVH